MKRARFSEEQIIAVLREAGAKVAEWCRRHGISDATFYTWRSRYGGSHDQPCAVAASRVRADRHHATRFQAGAGDQIAIASCGNGLRELAEERRRWGCPMLYLMLRREGWRANHKRVERLYREEGLSLRRRRRRKRLSHLRVARERPVAANQTWAVDFIHDSLISGRHFRAFAVLDRMEPRKPGHRSRRLAYRRARNQSPGAPARSARVCRR